MCPLEVESRLRLTSADATAFTGTDTTFDGTLTADAGAILRISGSLGTQWPTAWLRRWLRDSGWSSGNELEAHGILLSLSIPRDTSPAIQARLDEHYRAMTPLQRLHRSLSLRAASHRFAMAFLRQEFPEATELELRLRLALRTLPKELGAVLARRKGYPHLVDDLR